MSILKLFISRINIKFIESEICQKQHFIDIKSNKLMDSLNINQTMWVPCLVQRKIIREQWNNNKSFSWLLCPYLRNIRVKQFVYCKSDRRTSGNDWWVNRFRFFLCLYFENKWLYLCGFVLSFFFIISILQPRL